MYMRKLNDETSNEGKWTSCSDEVAKTYSNIDTLQKRVLRSNLSDDDKITIIKIIGKQGYRPIDFWYNDPPQINGDGSGGLQPPYEVYCNGEQILNERC